MATVAELQRQIDELREDIARMKAIVRITTGIDPDEVWVSTNTAATSLGISVYLLKQILNEAEDRRLSRRATQLKYGVHYRQKAATPERQINIVKFREWFNLPPEKRDQ